MQNMDFYTGKDSRVTHHTMGMQDADNVARMDAMYRKEADRNKKKATRMMSFIIGLCIISFTTGLVVGIKFAAGSEATIIDSDTRQAVSQIGNRVTSLIGQQNQESTEIAPRDVFPRNEYPFVIKMNRDYSRQQSREAAQFLSKQGHTVIVSKKDNNYLLFTGPFKTMNEADATLKKISEYGKKEWFGKSRVVRR